MYTAHLIGCAQGVHEYSYPHVGQYAPDKTDAHLSVTIVYSRQIAMADLTYLMLFILQS